MICVLPKFNFPQLKENMCILIKKFQISDAEKKAFLMSDSQIQIWRPKTICDNIKEL